MEPEKIDTTEDYVKFAKNYHRNAPYNWVRAVLEYYETDDEFLGQPNDTTTQNKLVKKQRQRTRLLLLEDSAPVGITRQMFSAPQKGEVMFWQEISLEGITARGSMPFYNSTGGDTEPECNPLKHR